MTRSILHISSDDLWGGAESQLALLLNNFNKNSLIDFECNLLTFNKGKLSKVCPTGKTFFANEQKGFSYVLKESLHIARKIDPAIIITHGYKEAIVGFIISKILKAKWVHQFHGSSESYTGYKLFKSKLFSYTERTIARYFADKTVFVANFVRKACGFENWSSSVVIHNSALKNLNCRNQSNSGMIKVAVVGRVAQVKRIDLAIDAFVTTLKSRAPASTKLELHIAGTGSLLDQMVTKAENTGLLESNIFFHGFVEDIDSFLQSQSLVFLTSDSEGLPTILLEAAHLGIPIVARDVGGVKEIKENLPGYPIVLVPSSDIKDIARVLYEVLNRDQLFNNSVIYNTDYFSVDRMTNDHRRLYESLIQ